MSCSHELSLEVKSDTAEGGKKSAEVKREERDIRLALNHSVEEIDRLMKLLPRPDGERNHLCLYQHGCSFVRLTTRRSAASRASRLLQSRIRWRADWRPQRLVGPAFGIDLCVLGRINMSRTTRATSPNQSLSFPLPERRQPARDGLPLK